jgi:hypothetical protein
MQENTQEEVTGDLPGKSGAKRSYHSAAEPVTAWSLELGAGSKERRAKEGIETEGNGVHEGRCGNLRE